VRNFSAVTEKADLLKWAAAFLSASSYLAVEQIKSQGELLACLEKTTLNLKLLATAAYPMASMLSQQVKAKQ
jgi:hypothetical protein